MYQTDCYLISVSSSMFQPKAKVTKHSLHNPILCWDKLFGSKIFMHILSLKITLVISLVLGPTRAPFSQMPNHPCMQWQQSGALVHWHLPYWRSASGNLRMMNFAEPKPFPEIQKYQQQTTSYTVGALATHQQTAPELDVQSLQRGHQWFAHSSKVYSECRSEAS